MQYNSGFYWHAGSSGAINEDTVSIQHIRIKKKQIFLAIVCDGIGSLPEGDRASGYVAEKMTQWFYREIPRMIRKKKRSKTIKASVVSELHQIHIEMEKYRAIAGCREHLGSTLTMLLVIHKKYYLFHLGDSKCFYLKKRLGFYSTHKCLSKTHQKNGVLFKAIGSFPFQTPQILMGKITGKCGFLLCTDGFIKHLKIDKLYRVCMPKEMNGQESIQKRLKELGDEGRRRGEKDDASAVYLRVGK